MLLGLLRRSSDLGEEKSELTRREGTCLERPRPAFDNTTRKHFRSIPRIHKEIVLLRKSPPPPYPKRRDEPASGDRRSARSRPKDNSVRQCLGPPFPTSIHLEALNQPT